MSFIDINRINTMIVDNKAKENNVLVVNEQRPYRTKHYDDYTDQ